MAIFTVTTTTDGGAGSLRDALDLANATAGDDTIQLEAGLVYTLTLGPDNDNANVGGDLDVTAAEGLVIEVIGDVAGLGNATIDASGIPMNDRVLDVRSGAATLSLINVNLTGGDVPARGGAVRLVNNATFNLTDSMIMGNTAGTNGGGIGGINGNTITITNSTISDNTAGDDGGGIFVNTASGMNPTPSLMIVDSTISGNTAGPAAANNGGGIFVGDDHIVDITSSTISGNSTFQAGGGLFSNQNEIRISNSTFSGNTAELYGGGIGFSGYLGTDFLTIENSTITLNTAGTSGGVIIGGTLGTVELANTIVAGNLGTNPDIDNVSFPGTVTSNGFNLIGDNTGVAVEFPAPTGVGGTDIVGTGAAPIDPLLGALADNGGPTETHELLVGSPAIDAGDPAFVAPPDFDQRGTGFPRIVNAVVDIGAFETQIDLAVDKFAAVGSDLTPLPGEQITYNIEISAEGGANADNVSIVDTFPAELSGVEWSFTDSLGTVFMGTDDIAVDGVAINGGETITITATGYVDCDLISDSTITNTATASLVGGDMDADPANNTDTDTSFVIPANSPGVFGFGNMLLGSPFDDEIIGDGTDQIINGNSGNDSMFGSGGTDNMNGGFGNDLLVGGSGNDFLDGQIGDDTLDGACTTLGVDQQDRLSGGPGSDLFVIGNQLGAFYLGNGDLDFAYITDFNPAVDTLQLNGAAIDYTTMQTSVMFNNLNITGQGIFQGGDLVAILQQSAADLALQMYV
jgi:uncharacterized repeat protein (TIGR01451 family)